MAKFVGKYIEDMTLALKASVVSHQHALLISPPGWGKTDVCLSAAHKCLGAQDGTIFLRFASSTPPQKVEGMFDPQAAIANPPRFVLQREGTLFDPNGKIIIADEIGRPSDIVFDILIDGLNRKDIPAKDVPVIWGTSNFAMTSARSEALRDRIGLWAWFHPKSVDIGAVVNAHANAIYQELEIDDFPTWDIVQDVRSADPGKHALSACREIIELLAQEAAKASLEVNARRATQWFDILFRTNVLMTGKADFSSLEPEASKCLTWAWVNTDETKANEWAKIATCVVDIVGTAVDELKRNVLDKVKTILRNPQGNTSRSGQMIEFGRIIQEGKREIESLGSKDKRVKEALDDLEATFVRIARGEDPFI